MTNDSVTIKIAHGDRPPAVRSSLSIDETEDIIRGLANEPDATVTVSLADMDAEVMLAISDAKFFLGLFRSSGEVYQYVARGNEGRHGKIMFSISGEPTSIEAIYVTDKETAAAAVHEWLRGGHESATFGYWKRM